MRYVLDPTDDWGKIPSQLLDRGSFFSTPDPSEEELQVDEEYDVENIWETDSPENVQENSIVPGLALEEIGPQVPFEENSNNGNAGQMQISESVQGIKDENLNLAEKFFETKVKLLDGGECELVKDEVPSTYAEEPSPLLRIVANSKKGRRYSKDFKEEVSEYFKSHTVKETMQFFGIPKTSVQRWTSVKDKRSRQSQSYCQPVSKNEKEEVLRYKETHTYSETSSKFGVPVSSIQSWTATRRQSEGISRAVLEGVLATLGDHLESDWTNLSGGKKKKREVKRKRENSEEISIDMQKTLEYSRLPPARRISRNPSQKGRPPKKKRKNRVENNH